MVSKSLFGEKPPKSKYEVLRALKNIIGHEDWFIAGSYAHPKIKRPNDIDVFFLTEEGRISAITNITRYAKTTHRVHASHASEDADSFYVEDIGHTVQVIKRHTGTPQEVMSRFDLNVCKRGILSNGNRTSAIGALGSLRVDKLNYGTFKRYFKYMNYLDLGNNADLYIKDLVDRYIEDSTIVKGYYDGQHLSAPVNQTLIKAVTSHHLNTTYLYAQAKLRAPELLI